MNVETARTQAALNRGNTYTPMGSVTNRDLGGEWMNEQLAARRAAAPATTYRDEPIYSGDDGNGNQVSSGTRRVAVPGTFDEAATRTELEGQNPFRDQWRTDVTLSPGQQRIYDQGEQLSGETGRLALDQLPTVRNLLAQPYARDDADARNRATAGIMSRLEPQFQRDREGLEGRLLSQGFVPGSEAYNRAADELGRARNDARMQADTIGMNESRAAAGFNNAQRAQQVQELGMLFGIGPGAQLPQSQQLAPVGVNAPDYQGAVAQNYQQQVAGVASQNAVLGQLLGSAARGGMQWSDRRLKRDIERVGTHDSGLPVYRFRYLWDDAPHIGVMADDVAMVRPEAVHITASGYAAVDYAAI
jgi:hypothetical protein